MTATLRPYLPTDAPVLAVLFQASIEMLTEEAYSAAQRAAWAAAAEDAGFADKLAKGLTLLVGNEEGPLGFGTLENNATVSMLYVHPHFARNGVATLIMDALEKLAAARGTRALKVDASDTALPFFTGRGYEPVQRNTVTLNGEWLANTTMEKKLGEPAKGGA